MYIAVVDRSRFVAEIRGATEIARILSHPTVTTDNDRKPALMLHYEIDVDEGYILSHNELIVARPDGAIDFAGSLLGEMQRDGLPYELELRGVKMAKGTRA